MDEGSNSVEIDSVVDRKVLRSGKVEVMIEREDLSGGGDYGVRYFVRLQEPRLEFWSDNQRWGHFGSIEKAEIFANGVIVEALSYLEQVDAAQAHWDQFVKANKSNT